MKMDEGHIQTLFKHIKDNMTDPFDVDFHPDVLLNISTGVHATLAIQISLMSAVDTGERQYASLVQDALSTTGRKSFYDPIRKLGLIMFS
jgi:hypothetical protein